MKVTKINQDQLLNNRIVGFVAFSNSLLPQTDKEAAADDAAAKVKAAEDVNEKEETELKPKLCW